ncbi:hypothetical protein BN961_04101 [Afipia felis]|uniref:Uncharacterized protein n=1 Tax=Afipia felis TaxID=1035 RepID=A0A090MTH9_AFIFE|nr:hypothetical protein BN961_04101 [Afipia felis]
MPAACSFSGRLSTRKASITMSCVAEAAATNSAASATPSGLVGSLSASSTMATISSNWEKISQARRRPSRRVRIGTCSASTRGAQKNLIV